MQGSADRHEGGVDGTSTPLCSLWRGRGHLLAQVGGLWVALRFVKVESIGCAGRWRRTEAAAAWRCQPRLQQAGGWSGLSTHCSSQLHCHDPAFGAGTCTRPAALLGRVRPVETLVRQKARMDLLTEPWLAREPPRHPLDRRRPQLSWRGSAMRSYDTAPAT